MTIHDYFTAEKGLSKQLRYQRRRVAKGLCRRCGRRKIRPGSKSQCAHCLTLQRTYQRELRNARK